MGVFRNSRLLLCVLVGNLCGAVLLESIETLPGPVRVICLLVVLKLETIDFLSVEREIKWQNSRSTLQLGD